MTKFINEPENITRELLEGYVAAYSDKVALAEENIVVRAIPKDQNQKWQLLLWAAPVMNLH
jgi:phosphoenolpyruvate---glycerone phosphotransferase subunit DhaK